MSGNDSEDESVGSKRMQRDKIAERSRRLKPHQERKINDALRSKKVQGAMTAGRNFISMKAQGGVFND